MQVRPPHAQTIYLLLLHKKQNYLQNSGRFRAIQGDTKARLEPEPWASLEPFIEKLDALPVGLRYRLDGSDFRELNEEFYYETVGSDEWLDQLYSAVKLVADSLNAKLQSHSRVISAAELREEILKPAHNKYAKKSNK